MVEVSAKRYRYTGKERDEETGLDRQGKGRKDRVVPIGERALLWVGRYLDEVRPGLVAPPGHAALFVNHAGAPIPPARLTQLMRRYVDRAGLGKTGACHVFRHTMATLMLEGGADVRLIQEILGHPDLHPRQHQAPRGRPHRHASRRQPTRSSAPTRPNRTRADR